MYYEFYGFKKPPFNATSNAHFFFESNSHQEAYAAIKFGISERKGLILITGEVGTGKTTLCKKLLGHLDPSVKVSLILNPYFSDIQLLQAIVGDFGISTVKKNRLDIIKELNNFLIDLHGKNGNAVLIIDEAQHLSARQLEQVRLLSNLEASDEKLLQVILVGQPELNKNLEQYRLRQVRQRILVKHHLLPLNPQEVREYIQLRFNEAGKKDININEECYPLIFNFSSGVPRLINILCDRALLIGYVREQSRLDQLIIEDSIREII